MKYVPKIILKVFLSMMLAVGLAACGGGGGDPPVPVPVIDTNTNTWTATTTDFAPSARSFHTAVWTGSEMIVWGGGGRL